MQASIELGTIIQNRYRVLSVLGQGGFGRTYLAEDQSRFNELCAIKELIPPSAGDYALQKSKELFQREAQVLYQIKYPQVPQFHATFEQDGRFFIVQDYINGKTYREQLDQLRSQGYVFSEAEVQQLITQLLPTLTYLHGKGIIHRDISPENIILRERDRLPVLIDFGVVKELATKIQSPNQSGIQATTVGKIGFAPTEQMQTGRAFPNSDLYALAVTAIVLLTGREPQELLDDRTMQWHWQRWASVTPGFAAVITRMLSYAPGDRYASATDVERAIQSLGNAPAIGIQPTAATVAPSQAPPPAPNPTIQATVAVGRSNGGSRSQPYRQEPAADLARNEPNVPRQSSLWDDPFAVLFVGLGLMTIAGIGTWAAFNAFNRSPNEPPPIVQTTPTPILSESPEAAPSPAVFNQSIELTSGKTATRSATLKANETLNFTFPGNTGDTLKAVMRGGEGVLFSVIGPDGKPLKDGRRVSTWDGTLPQSGNYALELNVIQGLKQGDFALEVTQTTPAKPEPTPSVTPTPTPTPSVTPSPDPTPPDPNPSPTIDSQRINFPQGATRVVVPGNASPTQTQRYLIQASAGQILKVGVDGTARLSLFGPDGKPIENASGVKARSLQLPSSGDYVVEVSSAEPSDFQLEVDVK